MKALWIIVYDDEVHHEKYEIIWNEESLTLERVKYLEMKWSTKVPKVLDRVPLIRISSDEIN